jgi:hypothetical protein
MDNKIKKLIEMAHDYDWNKRAKAAENVDTPVEVLNILSRDENKYVRECVANNINTPTETLVRLSQDKSWCVRMVVARNQNIPAETLVELSHDNNDGVLLGVFNNEKTQAEIAIELLTKLISSKHENIRSHIACSIKTKPETLIELSQDNSWCVWISFMCCTKSKHTSRNTH